MRIRIVVMGRSYHLTQDLPEELELAAGATIDDALAELAARLPAGERFSASCLVAVTGRHLGTLADHAAYVLQPGDELTLIAPVAGG